MELFTSKFQSVWFKILRARGEDLKPLTGELEHNLEVRLPLPVGLSWNV